MLAEISTAEDAANVTHFAEAARVYAKQAKLGTGAINHATSIKLKAEIRLARCVDEGQARGEIARKGQPRNIGGADITLSDLGVTAQKVQDARLIAETFADDDEINAHVSEATASDVEVSRSAIVRDARVARRRAKSHERSQGDPGPMPGGKYSLILADPPWVYPEDSNSPTRKIENHYPTASFTDIEAMEIPAAEDAVLLMWGTSPLLPEQLAVMKAWGFKYRTCAVWVKDRIGVGSWWRQQHELLLLGARGAPGSPLPENRPPSIIHAARREHSRKPDEIHAMAEAMFPHLTARLELFARATRPGWDTWGNDEAVAG